MNTTAEERQLLRTLAEEGLAEDNGSEAMAETWNLIIDTVDDLEQAIKHIHRLLVPAPVQPDGAYILGTDKSPRHRSGRGS